MVADTETPPLKSLALVETTKKSTSTWQKYWKLLYRAEYRFPDVIRDLADGDSMNEFTNEKV